MPKPIFCKDTDPVPHNSRLKQPHRPVLAWPAWLRMLAVLPAIGVLWLAVGWALAEVAPW